MEPEDIKTQEELWHWLEARPEASARLDAACIGLRAALRILPIWGAQLGTAEAEKSGFSALHALRALQAANVAQVFPSEIPADLSIAISKAAGEAADKAYAIDLRISHAVNAASGAAGASAHLKPQDKKDDGAFANGAYCAEAARNALRTDAEREVVWNATRNDARELLNGSQPFDLPLWLNTTPDWFVSMDQLTRRRFGNAPETWSFWRRWWDGVLSGNQVDWDLQRKVALIPEAIWQQGPEAVARAIAIIEEKRRLRDELAALEAQAQAAIADLNRPAPRDHNGPPDLIGDEESGLHQVLRNVVAVSQEARLELAAPSPRPERLREWGTSLRVWALAIVHYAGAKLDVFVTEVVKELAKSVGFTLKAAILSAVLAGTVGPALQNLADQIASSGKMSVPTQVVSPTHNSPAGQQP
jgi:hypothetical protein